MQQSTCTIDLGLIQSNLRSLGCFADGPTLVDINLKFRGISEISDKKMVIDLAYLNQ